VLCKLLTWTFDEFLLHYNSVAYKRNPIIVRIPLSLGVYYCGLFSFQVFPMNHLVKWHLGGG
jgi:hypothetical protein